MSHIWSYSCSVKSLIWIWQKNISGSVFSKFLVFVVDNKTRKMCICVTFYLTKDSWLDMKVCWKKIAIYFKLQPRNIFGKRIEFWKVFPDGFPFWLALAREFTKSIWKPSTKISRSKTVFEKRKTFLIVAKEKTKIRLLVLWRNKY